MAAVLHDPESLLAEDMGKFFYDPLGWVKYSFEWGRGELTGFDGPDEWQIDFLRDLGDAIRGNNFDGVKPVDAYRCATSSGHGIGKSALTAWLILYIMSTRPQCKGVVTANTSEQLRTKTWGELGKWKKRCITGHWFEYNNGKGNMNIYHVDHMESWRCDGQTCREENSESFAGLHAANSSPFYIFDEASAVPDKIWEVAEGGLTDGEPFWFAFGNPTRNTGRFRECFRKFRHRWRCKQIDSRKAKMTNKELIEQWANDYGEDSDFFKVRVRGLFPSASDLQFIPQATVDEAMRRHLRPENYEYAPKIIGVDPAYSGADEACIYLRQGLNSQLLGVYQKTDDDVKFAEIVAGFEDKHKAEAVFIDFGYGTGIHSVGKSWGRRWRLVQFGGESSDPAMLNKRGEIWNSMKKWLEEGGRLNDQQTADELVAPEYKVKLDGKIVLEAKDDMKRRGVPSPNRADALAITFAFPVVKSSPSRRNRMANTDYQLFG
ncbi:terminase [Yokenella regensburgei]|uniref:terminase n=1 Tax=Yokenella regensburgei TaxID=158877 RepID=UPI0014334690|nr:terminase [Yokenella regensburgei]QIU92141.1 terminase [Yokenella regensburgei]